MFDHANHLISRLSYAPLVTIAVSLLAVATLSNEHLRAWLVYDRLAIAGGEFWRLLGGHVTHWNGDHLFWDVVMFGLLGALIESRQLAAFAALVVSSAAAISAVLWFCHPEIVEYRGLSGIDSALFVYATILLVREARQSGSRRLGCALLMALVGFGGKIAYELLTGTTLFVDSAAAGFAPLPLVHAVGGLVGAALALASTDRKKGQARFRL